MPESGVLHAAELVALTLTPEEREILGPQLEGIVRYFDRLRQVALKGVEPTSHVVDLSCPRRPDEVERCELDFTPTFHYLRHRFFFVPPAIESG